MSWTCSNCGKTFRNNNQWHSCYSVDINEHVKNKSKNVQETITLLINEIYKFGNVSLNPVKSVIQAKAGATFLSIKAKKEHVELEFQLGYEVHEFPVHKAIRISKNRVFHAVTVDSPNDIDKQLLTWIKDSYFLVNS